MNTTTQIQLKNKSIIEVKSKYLKYSDNFYIAITSPTSFIMVYDRPDIIEIEQRFNEMDLWKDWFEKANPVTGAEFENVLHKAFEAIKNSLYAKVLQPK